MISHSDIKIQENGLEYFDTLPEGFIKANFFEQYSMVDKDKGRIIENLVVRQNLMFILYNPITKLYYPRYINNYTNMQQMNKYINDGNIYLHNNDFIWKT